MAIERPTFSENWYRVARLRPRLRASVQAHRQHFRGRRWQVLRDQATNRFYRLDEASALFIGLLDGRRSVDEAWTTACEQLGDEAPTQPEAIGLLGQLYSSNLLEANLPPDAAGLLKRKKQRVAREVRSYLMNVLFARFPLWDPDAFLDRWTPLLGWCFGPVGILLWVAMLALGLNALAGRWDELWHAASGVLAPQNLFWLYVAGVVTKGVHELGHGIACKHFGQKDHSGGEVHTIGIMLMVLVPVPYVDASSAWAFSSKWRRAFVGAAGVYTELALAAVAALVWARTAQGTLAHGLAYNVIFISGVSTLLFNLNPLIRFDGYYILSDLTETPNLAGRAKQKLHWLAKRYAYGVRRALDPARSLLEGVWLVIYGVAAFVYRIFLSIAIIWFVADKFFFVGALMVIGGLIGWVLVPLAQFVRYLGSNPELERVRKRAVLATVLPLVLAGLLVGAVPLPEHGRAQGVVEPVRMALVHAQSPGWITRMLPSGSDVAPESQPLVVGSNPELRSRRDALAAQLRWLELERRHALTEEVAHAQALAEQVQAVREELEHAQEQLANLNVAAPLTGQWLSGDAHEVHGRFVKQGELLGVVADLDELRVRITADQYLGPRLAREVGLGQPVELRVQGRPQQEVTGRIVRIVESGQRELPTPALGYAGGGSLAVSQQDEAGTQAAEPFFEVHIEPKDIEAFEQLLSGQRVVARFQLPASPLAWQAWRHVRQAVQERFHL